MAQQSREVMTGKAGLGVRFADTVRTGDRTGAHALLSQCAGRLRGYLGMRFSVGLGGQQGVEAIISAAIWKAIEHGHRYQPEQGDLPLWLWRIGVHLAQDEVRRAATRRRHERSAAVRPTVEPGAEGLQELVREAICSLSDSRHRTILETDLAHGGLAPSTLLAKQLGLAEQTILNLRNEARKLIRPRLEGLIRDDA